MAPRALLTLAWGSSRAATSLAMVAAAWMLSGLTPSPLINGLLPAVASAPLLLPVSARPRSGVALQLLASLWLGLWPALLSAHGGGTPQITDAPAGPFRLFVWTNPDPWRTGAEVHVTVAVTEVDGAGQTTPVTDAVVTVRLYNDGQPAQEVTLAATPLPAAAGFYEADGLVPGAGRWQVEVQITGSAGVGAGSFTQEVQPGDSSINWLVWGGGALALVALVGFAGTRRRRGTTAARHRAASAVAQE